MPVLTPPPVGYDGIIRFCGDIGAYLRQDGTISREWESEKLAFARLPAPMVLSWDLSTEISRVRVHKKAVGVFEAAFRAVHQQGLWRHLRVFGGAYVFRVVRGAAKLSTHAFGLGTDHDPKGNPLGTPPSECAMPRDAVEVMEDYGFTWGGRFSGRPDCMHFQFARRY